MFNNNYVTMDITNSDIRIIAANKKRIKKWSSTPLPEGVVKAGIVREPQVLSVIIDNIFDSLSLKRNRVICNVTGLPFIYRTVSLPGTERIPAEAIERESRREMSLAKEDMYLSWQVSETHPDTKEVDYFVLGVPRTSLDPLVLALSKARIKPYIIDIKPLALAREASLKDTLVVSLEKGYFDVVVVADGWVRVIHSVNPSNKSGEGIGLVTEIVDALNKAIKSFERDFPKISLPADTPILLSGELSSDKSLPLLVREASGHPVNIITSSLNTPADMPVRLFAAALGLASKKASVRRPSTGYHDINLNLLMGLKTQKSGERQLAYAIPMLVCLVLAALVYKTYDLKINAAGEVGTYQQEVDRLTRSQMLAQKANSQAVANQQTASNKLQDANATLAAIQSKKATIDNQRVDFASWINEAIKDLPEGADFKTIDLQTNTITVTGTAQGALDVPAMADALEKSAYFSGARVAQLAPAQDGGYTFQLAISVKTAN
jgi:Tfp pilus assembly protein PilN